MNVHLLEESDVGRWVVFDDGSPKKTEIGKIKSWNWLFIFVVFSCADDWDDYKNYTGCACSPKQLRFLNP